MKSRTLAVGLGYQTKTHHGSGLKSPLDHVLQTMGSQADPKHERSKTEMYNTILGFIDKNGGNIDDPALLKELGPYTQRNIGKISLPKVKLKNNLNEKKAPFLST